MCGICGIVNTGSEVNTDHLLQMARILRHRGPDDEGFLLADTKNNSIRSFHHDETIEQIKFRTPRLNNDFNANLGFGFRRLSIIDLSENAHQPMHFKEAGLSIVYNGEIYNYIELRDELKQLGYSFISNSDTEVILKSYHRWGEECVHKFNGMWAFAIWDATQNKLFCSRDRFGEKPFYYYYEQNAKFIFSSEIKAILPLISSKPDQRAIFDYYAFGYCDHNERTFYQNIFQLRGGHNLILKDGAISIYKYYNLNQTYNEDSFESAKKKFRELLFDAVKIRLRSDVPLGYALSGGIDSSSIIGIGVQLNKGINNTFSMVYPGYNFDESFYIQKVIEKTGCNSSFITPDFSDFKNSLNDFIYSVEQPFISLSHFGNYILRKFMKLKEFTVILDGQGADEIISGYSDSVGNYSQFLLHNNKYSEFFQSKNIQHKLELKKYFVRKFNLKKKPDQFLASKYQYINFNEFDDQFNFDDPVPTYKISRDIVNNKLYEQLIYTSLPSLLIFGDKNSMASSVESRFPFLDYRLVEYAFSLPASFKIRDGITKLILRDSVRDLIPTEVYERTDKIGFEVPDNKFNKVEYNEYMVKLLNTIAELNNGDIKFINMKKFVSHYNKPDSSFDWKFWKTASLLLWYREMFLTK